MLLPLGLGLGFGVTLTIVSIVGLCLNGCIIIILVLTKQITSNNILLIHLSVTQSLLSLVFLVFSFPPIVHHGIWIASTQFSCDINGFLLTILHPLALWTICGLNCDRFYAISAPLHYSAVVTNRKVISGLVSGWIVVLFLSVPTFTKVASHTFSTSMIACVPNFSTQNSLWYAILFTFATLIIPGIVIITCNIKVLMIARYHRHRIAAAIYEVTLSAQVAITHQRNPFFIPTITAPSAGGPKFRSRSPISTVLQLVGSFVLIYLPYYISITLNSLTAFIYDRNGSGLLNNELDGVPQVINKTNQYILLVAQFSLTSSTVINAILYGLKSKIVRTTFQNYWRKKRTKNEIQQEIQARTPSTCGSRRPSVSNLGFLTRPLLQRRLSETFIDIKGNANDPNQRPKMKRIASELTWTPIGLALAGLESPTIPRTKESVTHAASCNTLQVPTGDTELFSDADRELYNSVRNSFRAAKLMDRKVINFASHNSLSASNDSSTLGNSSATSFRNAQNSPILLYSNRNHNNNQKDQIEHHHSSKLVTANHLLLKVLRIDTHREKRLNFSNLTNGSLNHKNDKSKLDPPLINPKILITRALSDESGSKTPSLRGTPTKKVLRQYSSANNLADLIDYYDLDNSSELEKFSIKNNETDGEMFKKDSKVEYEKLDISNSNDSTTFSELYHRRYSSMEETSYYSRDYDMDSVAEEQLLLSWPTTSKKLKIYSGGKIAKTNIHKIGNFILNNNNSNCSNNGNYFDGTDNHKSNYIRNIKYRPSPLFNDRCEEPEVIL